MVCPQQWRTQTRRNPGSTPGPEAHNPLGEEEIQDFWGQLWSSPKSQAPRGARVRGKKGENLVWVRRDLWESKDFSPGDCFLVREGDTLSGSPRRLDFAELFWSDDKRRSFAQVVGDPMAGRGRGRGPRPRQEEDWERWGGGGWSYQYPPPPPPQFFSQPPPLPYGFYPNHPVPPPGPQPPP